MLSPTRGWLTCRLRPCRSLLQSAEPAVCCFSWNHKNRGPFELMGKKKRRQQRGASVEQVGSEGPLVGGLGGLLAAQGFTASSDMADQAPTEQHPTPSRSEDVVARAHRWIVRISKKGRGGREATLLSARGLPEKEDLSSLARRIRKQMGCGASLEGPDVLVQGDQRERLERWLIKHGARKVTQG